MKKIVDTKAFTLIEVLVVISIVVLLAAVLMPSLIKVRAIAQRAACSSNLHQIAVALELYEADYDYKRFAVRNNDSETSLYWMGKLAKYVDDPEYGRTFKLGETVDILLCPSAPASKFEPDDSERGNPSGQWGTNDRPWEWHRTTDMSTIGSYTINGWLAYDYYYEKGSGAGDGPSPACLFQGWDNVRLEAPIFGDGIWTIGWPKGNDPDGNGSPALPDLTGCTTVPNANDYLDSTPNDLRHMWRFCIDRHLKKINLIFKDTHVEAVGLKELWRIPWHKGYQYPTQEITLPSH